MGQILNITGGPFSISSAPGFWSDFNADTIAGNAGDPIVSVTATGPHPDVEGNAVGVARPTLLVGDIDGHRACNYTAVPGQFSRITSWSMAGQQNISLYLIMKNTGATVAGGELFLSDYNGGGGCNLRLDQSGGGTDNGQFRFERENGTGATWPIDLRNAGYQLVTLVYATNGTTTNNKMYLNGTLRASFTDPTALIAGASLDWGRYGAGILFTNSAWSRKIYYNTAHDAPIVAAMNTFLHGAGQYPSLP